MNLNILRSQIMSYLNVPFSFVYHSGRGQDEFFSGKIVQIYSRIFLIKDQNDCIHSFSYSDFLIKTLKIIS